MTFTAWSNHDHINIVQVTLGDSQYILILKYQDISPQISIIDEKIAMKMIDDYGLTQI